MYLTNCTSSGVKIYFVLYSFLVLLHIICQCKTQQLLLSSPSIKYTNQENHHQNNNNFEIKMNEQYNSNNTDGEYYNNIENIHQNKSEVTYIHTFSQNIENIQTRNKNRIFKSIVYRKWRYICCVILKSFRITKKFSKVRNICKRFKCYTNWQTLQEQQKIKSYQNIIQENYKLESIKSSLENNKVEPMQSSPENNSSILVNHDKYDSAIAFTVIIILSLIYLLTTIAIFVALANGTNEQHYKQNQNPMHSNTNVHENNISEKLPLDMIQHIHIYLKNSQNKIKKKESESMEEKDGEEVNLKENSKENNKNNKHNKQRRNITRKNRTRIYSKNSKINKKEFKNITEDIKQDTNFKSILNTIKNRSDLEGKELAKEILGLTAEGMHTAAYSLLLVNVLGEILEDTLERGGGEPMPPGGGGLLRNITLKTEPNMNINMTKLESVHNITTTNLFPIGS